MAKQSAIDREDRDVMKHKLSREGAQGIVPSFATHRAAASAAVAGPPTR